MNSPSRWRLCRPLVCFELRKIFAQGRFNVGVAVVAGFVLLSSIGAQSRLYSVESRGRQLVAGRSAAVVYTPLSFAFHAAAPAMDIIFPLLVGVMCAAVAAGEIESGQTRTQALRPVSRTSLLLAKAAAVALVVSAHVALMWLLALGVGAVMFNFGDEVFIQGGVFNQGGRYLLAGGEAWWRYWAMLALAIPSVWGYACVFTLFSAVFKRFSLAAAVPVGVYLISMALERIPFFSPARNFLPTYYFQYWKQLGAREVDFTAMARDGAMAMAISLACVMLACNLFENSEL